MLQIYATGARITRTAGTRLTLQFFLLWTFVGTVLNQPLSDLQNQPFLGGGGYIAQ